MTHDVLIAVFMLVSILTLLLVMWWSRGSLQGIDWERRRKIKEARIMAMLPHLVQLWQNLLYAVRDHKSDDEIKKLSGDIEEYIRLMVQ
jgi:hypothetical protein